LKAAIARSSETSYQIPYTV